MLDLGVILGPGAAQIERLNARIGFSFRRAAAAEAGGGIPGGDADADRRGRESML